MKRSELRIEGRVQGVGFRAAAVIHARSLGLAGFVRNEPDGSVFAAAEGPDDAVDRFAAWCRQGPPGASVVRVESNDTPPRGHGSFTADIGFTASRRPPTGGGA